MPKYTPEKQLKSFWNKVNKDGSIPAHCPELGPCWEWTAYCSKFGYGNKNWFGKMMRVHRISWELSHGSIPDKLLILHKCDNRKCVNPAHLFLGTHKQNTEDMKRKGRSKFHKVQANELRNLTRVMASEIYRRYEAGDISQAKLSSEYGLSAYIIWFIVHFNDW